MNFDLLVSLLVVGFITFALAGTVLFMLEYPESQELEWDGRPNEDFVKKERQRMIDNFTQETNLGIKRD